MGYRETAERQDRFELELLEERAAALLRSSQTLESLIEELRLLRAEARDLHWSSRSSALSRFRELRRRAVQYRWHLEVQREALGLHPTYSLDEFYPLPDPP